MNPDKLTQADAKSICDAAQAAWDAASKRARVVRFTWNGHSLRSTLTGFRMLVETPRGQPVCCRYF